MKTASLALLLMPMMAAADGSAVDTLRQAFNNCHALHDADERLRCYDRLQDHFEPPRFAGSLIATTPPFDIAQPTRLRYQSDGPVFVMTLKNERGDVVQNLNLAGGGEAAYVIARPDRYSLQISGTDRWRIWLDPLQPE